MKTRGWPPRRWRLPLHRRWRLTPSVHPTGEGLEIHSLHASHKGPWVGHPPLHLLRGAWVGVGWFSTPLPSLAGALRKGGEPTSPLQWRGCSHHLRRSISSICFCLFLFFSFFSLILCFDNTTQFLFSKNTFQFTKWIVLCGPIDHIFPNVAPDQNNSHFFIFSKPKTLFKNFTKQALMLSIGWDSYSHVA
jgi:hypothetical protein